MSPMKKPRINIIIDSIDQSAPLAIESLKDRVDTLLDHFEIGHVEISGGGTLLLPPEYLLATKRVLMEREIDDIVVSTDLFHLSEVVHDKDFTISVTYDFLGTERSDRVFENIMLLSRPFFLVTSASDDFLDRVTPDNYVNMLSTLSLLWHAEIKSPNIERVDRELKTFRRVEEFIWQVINHPKRNFTLENEWRLDYVVNGEQKGFKEDCVYIAPTGEFGVMEVDGKGREHFKAMDSIDVLLKRLRVSKNATCNICPYYGKCLSEHTRETVAIDGSCNGFRNLIERWEKEP